MQLAMPSSSMLTDKIVYGIDMLPNIPYESHLTSMEWMPVYYMDFLYCYPICVYKVLPVK